MLTTGPAPLSLDGSVVGYGLPRRAIPLNEVRAILLHPATGRPARDAAWRHVVEEAHTGTPAWVIGAVGLALPALWRMAGDLAEGYRGDVADLHAAILAGFVAALHRVDTGRPGIVTRLRWAAYRAGLLARYTRQGIPPMPLPTLESAPPPQPWGHPDLLLADAVAKGVLSPLAAELIGRSRLEDLTLKQAAAELGVGVQAAYKARQRGERRLVAAIAAGDVEHRLSNPVPKSGLVPARETSARAPAPPEPESGPAGGPGREPAGVRGRSTESDGTSDSHHPRTEGGAFCDPARQPPTAPASPAPREPSTARRRRHRGGRRRRRPEEDTGGTP
ncbi:sigma-70 family RNA polymerase sigma factor [Actinomadura darangshiensis]|uniref:Sigma-70 family RNA polymerase sigma factor n=1 Tax=Actinomadura darangshiensis TaxID=705336 RepID=A0A4R5A199_9ACTN|nr:sigma-70 family RNA polymerase sigma factor [Actinomadura darangshiensis]TDD65501.1 sigma-70 family RNA polymerase sigma factor [Actinomadura darangshiensis]